MSAGAGLDAASFPDPDSRGFYSDGAVMRALSERGGGTHPEYGEAFVERMLGQPFAVARREVRPSGTRMLYHALPW
jgi:hypothetical protein